MMHSGAYRACGRFRRHLPVLGVIAKGGERSIVQNAVIKLERFFCSPFRKKKNDPLDYVRIKQGGPFMRAHHTPGTIRDRTRRM